MSSERPEWCDKVSKEFAEVVNRNSLENHSGTPDYILGDYLLRCLNIFNWATCERDKSRQNKAEKPENANQQTQPDIFELFALWCESGNQTPEQVYAAKWFAEFVQKQQAGA